MQATIIPTTLLLACLSLSSCKKEEQKPQPQPEPVPECQTNNTGNVIFSANDSARAVYMDGVYAGLAEKGKDVEVLKKSAGMHSWHTSRSQGGPVLESSSVNVLQCKTAYVVLLK